ncbi:SDR family oxidoreductase [Psychromarinibacter halotolerans]|uniref:SDR family oxidoreductase n=1 Tax=Psychromarinibacter halotolerans TaxID=1775175 RepID=A0ABV7GM18_9RHOB|nr:SDR family oxidoreductase [Psychromarinibacter halotolerans]MAQ84265.1 3-oxoacyl-[acyl-carrier-protein] reductase [Maritimibacter sp.]MDF0597244.1 SDR family oxidoreductase [Psychromarinibacter halotolerans]
MTGRLEGRAALVIGGARGIGGGIATRFAAEGAQVAIADLEDAEGKALAAELGGFYRRTDVSDGAEADAAVAEVVDRFGKIDILVQNAGIYPWTLIEDTSAEEWHKVLGVNLGGCFLATKAAVKHMKTQGYGRIVLTSSITGPRVTSPGHGHYSASKAGINGFIRSAAIEFAGYGVTVNGIEPGNILTEGMKAHRSAEFIKDMESAIPVGRMGTPADIAAAALFLASEEAEFITGTTIVVDGGQILPEGNDFRMPVG